MADETGSSNDASNHSVSPSSSTRAYGTGNHPLKMFSLLVGNKTLKLRIVDSAEVDLGMEGDPETPPPCDESLPSSTKKQSQNSPIVARVFDDSYPIVCQYCDQSFLSADEYWPHLQQLHGRYDKLFQCNVCSKVFARNVSFRMHMKTHEKDRSAQKGTDHESIEIENRSQQSRYDCSYCGKSFYHRRDLIVHERIHTNERPYECEFCGLTFIQSQALTVHVRMHTGERPYHCQACSQSFKDGPALKKHEFLKHGQ